MCVFIYYSEVKTWRALSCQQWSCTSRNNTGMNTSYIYCMFLQNSPCSHGEYCHISSRPSSELSVCRCWMDGTPLVHITWTSILSRVSHQVLLLKNDLSQPPSSASLRDTLENKKRCGRSTTARCRGVRRSCCCEVERQDYCVSCERDEGGAVQWRVVFAQSCTNEIH